MAVAGVTMALVVTVTMVVETTAMVVAVTMVVETTAMVVGDHGT